MKKFFSVLFSIIIFILLITLSINLSIEKLVIDTINDSVVKKEVSDFVTDAIYQEYPEISVDDLEKIEDFINESEEVNDITSKYFEGIMNSINNGDSYVPDIDDDLNSLIENNRDTLEEIGINDDEIDKISHEIIDNDRISEIYQVVSDNVSNNLTKEQELVIDIYNFFGSTNLRYGLIIGIFISVIFILVLDKSIINSCFKVGISSLIAGLFVKFGIIGVIDLISWEITNNVLGRTTSIETTFLNLIGYIYISIGIALIIISILIKKISSK